MECFAKIFETSTTQVLFYLEYNHEEDVTVLHAIGIADGAMFDVKGIYPGDDQEQAARKKFDSLTQENATKIVDSVHKMLGD